jgi:hypothetical protein
VPLVFTPIELESCALRQVLLRFVIEG